MKDESTKKKEDPLKDQIISDLQLDTGYVVEAFLEVLDSAGYSGRVSPGVGDCGLVPVVCGVVTCFHDTDAEVGLHGSICESAARVGVWSDCNGV